MPTLWLCREDRQWRSTREGCWLSQWACRRKRGRESSGRVGRGLTGDPLFGWRSSFQLPRWGRPQILWCWSSELSWSFLCWGRSRIALWVKAHWRCPIQIWQLWLPFYPRPNISDRFFNLAAHFIRIQIFQIDFEETKWTFFNFCLAFSCKRDIYETIHEGKKDELNSSKWLSYLKQASCAKVFAKQYLFF